MPKSDRQVRAEKYAQRLRANARKPIVIEFAGLPKAGKTSTINQLYSFLKRCGFRVEVVIERASVCPIRDKKHANFNIWTACTTLAQILEKTQDPPRPDDPDVLILDRGIFDAISWLTMMEKLARIRTAEREHIEAFLTIEDWRRRITGVILMTASPEDAMTRERGHLPVETTGSIMNPDVLNGMLRTLKETAVRLENHFRIFPVDTSAGGTNRNEKRTAEEVADIVLSLVEEQLEEEILYLPKSTVTSLFAKRSSLSAEETEPLLKAFDQSGEFRPRDAVEADPQLVQALPVVVVRNRSGELLRLRRRERSPMNSLHEKLVIWAGGHVRREDRSEGKSVLIQCALREIQEELRISLRPEDLELLGATYADSGGKTSQHVAIVYQWRAMADDIAIALSSAEFFERRGASLSGQFVDPATLAKDIEQQKLTEVWSVEIVRKLIPNLGLRLSPRLEF